jgi:hypothetical protein
MGEAPFRARSRHDRPSASTRAAAPDADGDGIFDQDDTCTNVGGGRNFLPGSQIKLGRINTDPVGGGNDTLSLKASFAVGGVFQSLDLDSKGARNILRNDEGEAELDASLPSGTYAGQGTRGWTFRPSRWKYLDTTGAPVAGITRFEVRDRGSSVKVKAVGSNGTYPVEYNDAPIAVTLVLGDQSSSEAGWCGESIGFAFACTFTAQGTKLRCKQ